METVKSPAEQRVQLPVSWETYERLLDERGESRVPRFTYDRGVLEIVSPSPEHERIAYVLALLVEVLAEEFDIELDGLGSTTFRREDLERGFEPDQCFYVQNAERIRGKNELDLSVDPPPDLIVEVDITNPSLDRFPIYASFGVPEVWRYDAQRVVILQLVGGEYVERLQSLALPPLTSDALTRFTAEGTTLGRRDWMRAVRQWAQQRGGKL